MRAEIGAAGWAGAESGWGLGLGVEVRVGTQARLRPTRMLPVLRCVRPSTGRGWSLCARPRGPARLARASRTALSRVGSARRRVPRSHSWAATETLQRPEGRRNRGTFLGRCAYG